MNRWFDKYFHWWERKNVFDVYLEKYYIQGDISSYRVVVILRNGLKGRNTIDAYTSYVDGIELKDILQAAYENAFSEKVKQRSDYEKYLKPTLGTTRPDPNLVSYIEKGYIPVK